MPKNNYIEHICSSIQGIPCLIGIKSIDLNCRVEDYDILDRKGYVANWLEIKITPLDELNIDSDIARWESEAFNL